MKTSKEKRHLSIFKKNEIFLPLDSSSIKVLVIKLSKRKTNLSMVLRLDLKPTPKQQRPMSSHHKKNNLCPVM
ncbi:hypothetical protein EB796_008097 [Bugula neritina]|uniref:Uncharacterized protein n=1 Tax=Bugula neritina TaxID=10212 RepID=A0A7J7K7J5_BUGNE|nr:hypothetical protein EB796_008097 [Bugula neritina]